VDELFKTRYHLVSLPLLEELDKILAVQEEGPGASNAMWDLLVQYSGLLQRTSYDVQARVTRMTPEQVEDLQSELVLAAIEAIKSFDSTRFMRLSQVLPGRLRDVALEMTTALTIPRGTLSLWFKIWRAGNHDFTTAEQLAPTLGMATTTFSAISHALAYAGSEWVTIPYTAGRPTADAETHRLAYLALAALSEAEREVIELYYGFRGDHKTDQEVANIVLAPRVTVSKRRTRALEKMRLTLA